MQNRPTVPMRHPGLANHAENLTNASSCFTECLPHAFGTSCYQGLPNHPSVVPAALSDAGTQAMRTVHPVSPSYPFIKASPTSPSMRLPASL